MSGMLVMNNVMPPLSRDIFEKKLVYEGRQYRCSMSWVNLVSHKQITSEKEPSEETVVSQ